MVTPTHRDQDGDAAAKLPRDEARQGQNVRGMTTVLVVGVVLVAIAYAIMLAFQSKPVTPDNVERNPAPAIESQETAQSPS
jgi:hypothetical protein